VADLVADDVGVGEVAAGAEALRQLRKKERSR
jgi:hypothetical protein